MVTHEWNSVSAFAFNHYTRCKVIRTEWYWWFRNATLDNATESFKESFRSIILHVFPSQLFGFTHDLIEHLREIFVDPRTNLDNVVQRLSIVTNELAFNSKHFGLQYFWRQCGRFTTTQSGTFHFRHSS
ncbi:hypothetical protein D3C72_1225330 [compost metagenome]